MNIVVYIGDTHEYLADIAKKYDPLATLVDSSNYLTLKKGTYYTSIGDLDTLCKFGQVLQQADTIVYAPPAQWTDSSYAGSKMQHWTEQYLSVFCCNRNKTVIGFDASTTNKTKMLSLAGTRKSDDRQVWIAGCSISHGVGVADYQRYGELISKELDLPVTFLTQPGSSVRWASDQILRSDIRANDIIFWGITGARRLSYWDESIETTRHTVLGSFGDHKLLNSLVSEKYIASDLMIYDSLVSIYNVINFCNINGIPLILATLLKGMEVYLKDFVNFVPLCGIFGQDVGNIWLDVGTDDRHPGPKSHQFFKEKMLEVYYQRDRAHDE